MSTNKFDKFYFKQSCPELIEKLLTHRITGRTLDKEWYGALILHFSKRELSDEQKTMIDYILNTDPEILQQENLLGQPKVDNVILIKKETKDGDLMKQTNSTQQKIIDSEILFNIAVQREDGKTREELYSYLQDNGLNEHNSNHVLDTLYKFIKNQRIKLIAGFLLGAIYFFVLIYFRIGGIAPWMLMGIPTTMVLSSFISPEKFKKTIIYKVND